MTPADSRSLTKAPPMTVAEFHARRRFAETPHGRIAYVEQGAGPIALFVHGFPLNGFFWRGAMAELSDIRRCIAVDLLGLGYTEPSDWSKLDFPTQADMLAGFLDALGVGRADIVANDSATAIVQMLAAKRPEKARTLTLTNGDTHDNYPPPAFTTSHDLAKAGKLGSAMARLAADPDLARRTFAMTHQFPERLTDETLKAYFEPLAASPTRMEAVNRYVASMDNRQMTACEADLRKLAAPALVVWADSDPFFAVKWAHWLGETLPNARVEIMKGAKLFFPEERTEEFCALLREHWSGGAGD